jgi:tight adherence protein B
MLIALLLVIGLLLIGSTTLLAGRADRRAAARRIDAVRARHMPGPMAVEARLRRITAQRTNNLDRALNDRVPGIERLRQRLHATGKNWTVNTYLLACAGLTFLSWGLLAWFGAPLLLATFLALLIGVGLPHFLVGRLIRKRVSRFLDRFPEGIDLLVRGLRAGLPIGETLSLIATELPDPVGAEFRGITDRMRIGQSMDAAMQDTAQRLGAAEFRFFLITLAIQRETGGNLTETLGNLANMLRKRLQLRLKIKAMASESTAAAYIVGALPFLVFGFIWYVNPTYLKPFFTDMRLTIALIGGLGWMGIGALVMAKMVSFEL